MLSGFRALRLVLGLSIRESPRQSLACLGEPAARLLELLQPLFLAWLVDGVLTHDAGETAIAAGGFISSVGIWLALDMIGIDARSRQFERVGFAFDARIGRISGSIPTVDHLQSATYLDEVQLLRDQRGALGEAFNSFVNSTTNLVYVAGTMALAASSDWSLLLVAAAGLPSIVATRWVVRWTAQAENASAAPSRLAQHLRRLGLSADAAAEMRVFGLESTLHARLRVATAAWRAPAVRLAQRQSIIDLLGVILFFGTATAVLGWKVHDVLAGTQPIGDLVLALMLVGRLQTTSGMVQTSIHGMTRTIRTASHYLWLLGYQQGAADRHRGTATPPTVLHDGIAMTHVSFSYPGASSPALDDITINLPAGSVIALIGENGAGKTTLVKLLTGMHQPTQGRITIDDTDIADLDLDSWRARVSGGFQDHVRFEFTAGETVGVGDLSRLYDEPRIHRALADGTGTEIIDALPHKLTTQLGSRWPGGIDLSGGQWQRLAISRAMMRAAPLLLVLDEPTAALDATTEHSLFNHYTTAAHRAGCGGAITLLITHRFSTATAADIIIVLDHGRVLEIGTHADLVTQNGRYAELYRLQARGYR